MRIHIFLVIIWISCVYASSSSSPYYEPPEEQAVVETEIKSLVFRDYQSVTSLRNRPLSKRLVCVGGTCSIVVKSMDCTRLLNSDWMCVPELENKNLRVHLSHVEVECQGHKHPDDVFVLPSGCALKYRVQLQNIKETKVMDDYWRYILLFFIFIVVVAVALCIPISHNLKTMINRGRSRSNSHTKNYRHTYSGGSTHEPLRHRRRTSTASNFLNPLNKKSTHVRFEEATPFPSSSAAFTASSPPLRPDSPLQEENPLLQSVYATSTRSVFDNAVEPESVMAKSTRVVEPSFNESDLLSGSGVTTGKSTRVSESTKISDVSQHEQNMKQSPLPCLSSLVSSLSQLTSTTSVPIRAVSTRVQEPDGTSSSTTSQDPSSSSSSSSFSFSSRLSDNIIPTPFKQASVSAKQTRSAF